MILRLFALALLALSLPVSAAPCSPLLSHDVNTLLGEKENLCEYAGKVVLVVNVASFCGYTPQYKGLQALHESYRKRGLVMLGFPSNDFGKQEPGSEKEIADFCDRTYAVKFPMFAKTSVGPGGSPFFDGLAKATGERPEVELPQVPDRARRQDGAELRLEGRARVGRVHREGRGAPGLLTSSPPFTTAATDLEHASRRRAGSPFTATRSA